MQISTHKTYTLLFFGSENTTASYLEGTAPLADYGDVVPRVSIPLSIDYRLALYPMNKKYHYYIDMGAQFVFHRGHYIETRRLIYQQITESSSGTLLPLILSSSNKSVTTYYTEVREMEPKSIFNSGIHVGSGLCAPISKRIQLTLGFEAGLNFFNKSLFFDNFLVRKQYLRLYASIDWCMK